MRLAVSPYMLRFRQPAGTSRGVLTEKPTYFIKLYDERVPEVFGLGECAVFPGLSPEADHRYEYKLLELLANIAIGRPTDLSQHSSIQYGLEMAMRDFAGGGRGIYFDSPWVRGESEIVINGLVWMGTYEEMLDRVEAKIRAGFHCIKIKIGAIDWAREEALIAGIRQRYTPDEVTIRVDANGGFCMENVFPRLKRLADLGVHSIEQPIPAGNVELMRFVCDMSPVPVALDESLIGVYGSESKARLLDDVRPAFIILKPALCGGFSGADEWIKLAESRGIGWWITSALESNIGLDALAQWTASLGVTMPQGLGTGNLYLNNLKTPVWLDGEQLKYDAGMSPVRDLSSLEWHE